MSQVDPAKNIPPPQPKKSDEKKQEEVAQPMFSTDPTIEAAMLSVWRLTSRKAREQAKEVNED